MERLTDLYTKETERASASWKKMERVRIRVNDKTPRLTEWLGSALTEKDQPWTCSGTNRNHPAKLARCHLLQAMILHLNIAYV